MYRGADWCFSLGRMPSATSRKKWFRILLYAEHIPAATKQIWNYCNDFL